MGDREVLYRVLVGKLREEDNWKESGVNVRIILRWIFRKWNVGLWTGLIGKSGGQL